MKRFGKAMALCLVVVMVFTMAACDRTGPVEELNGYWKANHVSVDELTVEAKLYMRDGEFCLEIDSWDSCPDLGHSEPDPNEALLDKEWNGTYKFAEDDRIELHAVCGQRELNIVGVYNRPKNTLTFNASDVVGMETLETGLVFHLQG